VSPARQLDVLVRNVGGSAGVPSAVSSLNMNAIGPPMVSLGPDDRGELRRGQPRWRTGPGTVSLARSQRLPPTGAPRPYCLPALSPGPYSAAGPDAHFPYRTGEREPRPHFSRLPLDPLPQATPGNAWMRERLLRLTRVCSRGMRRRLGRRERGPFSARMTAARSASTQARALPAAHTLLELRVCGFG
jgi:hypothetical protein